jgi:mRNA interferase MazF
MNEKLEIQRGDIWMVDLGENRGSIQGQSRPCIVTSNDFCNKYSPILTVVPITSKKNKKPLPTHVEIGTDCGLLMESTALCEQILSVNKTDLKFRISQCTEEVIHKIDAALMVQQKLQEPFNIERFMRLVNTLKNTVNMMREYNLVHVRDMQESVTNLTTEIKDYCYKYGMDYTKVVLKYNLEVKEVRSELNVLYGVSGGN